MGTQPLLPPGLRHVAIIMDGNGRWAQQQGLPRLQGHRRGAHSVREVVRAARKVGLSALTLYAFSEQNWERPLEEVQGLMQLLHDYVIEERTEILENGIRLQAIGNISRLPAYVLHPLSSLIAESAHNQDMVLSLALSYGGQESLADAMKKLAHDVAQGSLDPQQINEDELSARLKTAGLPKVDLMIRTSGEQRTSNFLLWESTRARFYATPVLWPDFGKDDLLLALDAYRSDEPAEAAANADFAKPGSPDV